MTGGFLIGCDVGTQRVKALALDVDGQLLGQIEMRTPWRKDGLQAELDPAPFADAVIAMVAELAETTMREHPQAGRVIGIGFGGMGETGALLDEAGEPLAPMLAWHDPRGELDLIKQVLGRDEFHRHTGIKLNSKPSLPKILWLQRNVDGTERAVRHLCMGEWLAYRLTGEQATEWSLLSRTAMYDIVGRQPWAAAVDLAGDLLAPRIVLAGDAVGIVDDRAPAVLRGAAVAIGGHDHQVAAFALGAARSGALFNSLGTAETLLRTTEPITDRDIVQAFAEKDMSVGWGVVRDHMCVLGGLLTGMSLERVAAMLGVIDLESRATLSRAALLADRSNTHMRLAASRHTGVDLVGISDGVTPAQVWKVAVEDLTAMVDEVLADMASRIGPHTIAIAAGGWLNDPMVAHVKSKQFGTYLTSDLPEAGAVGAAYFGGIAAGVLARPATDAAPTWSTVTEVAA